jgi:hypothetical protein
VVETKLLRTLRTLNRKDYSELCRYYSSGFISAPEAATALLDHLLSFKPSFTSPQLTKEKVFKKIFPGKSYADTKMRLVISDALKIVNQYIGISRIVEDTYPFEMLLLEHFSDAENNEHTMKRFDEFEKKLKSFPYRNEQYFYFSFRLEELKNNFFVRRSKDHDLSPIFRNLESFYFLNKLKLTCVRLSHNFIFKKEMGDAFVEEIIDKLERKLYNDSPIILGYSYGVLLLSGSKADKQFHLLYDLLENCSDQVSDYEKKVFSKILENYCIRQINSGHEQFYEMLYPLLENRLMEAEEISSSEVKTFITLCLRMEKPAVAHRFIQEKKNAIVPADIREDAFNYSMALLHFYRKEYNSVLTMLQQVEYLNVFYKIDSRKLLIQAFYELKEWDSLDSAMNAFRVFMHRNKEISDLHKKNNQNFINFLYKLVSAPVNKQKRLQQLRQQLRNSRDVAERKWLMEKLDERMG